MKRAWIKTIACMAVLFLFLFPVDAKAEGVAMKAEVGFDGTYLMGSWTPIRVNIKNTGNDLDGSLEVSVDIRNNRRIIYSTPVNLPKASEKEYTFYARIPNAVSNLNIRLTDSRGKAVTALMVNELNPIGFNNYFLGLVTDDQPSLGYWKEIMAGNYLLSNYIPISLDASSFPVHREVLSSFSVLIFNNIDTDAFRPEQLDILNDWLEDGGVLIVGTGVNGKRTLSGLSGSILPILTGELGELGSPALLEELTGREVLSTAPLQVMDIRAEKIRVLLGDEETGLVWGMQKGRGTVFISAFDLGTEPILSWTGSKLLWENLLAQNLSSSAAARLSNPYEYNQGTDSLAEALGNIDAMEMPSVMLILFLFLFYLALVGPINYSFLKKIDKREWSWVTIPVLSILFAALIFGLGYNTKGGGLIANTISVVNMKTNEEYGDLTNYIGIFTPGRGNYEVQLDRFALLSTLGDPDYRAGSSKPEARIVQGNPSKILFENVNIWTMKTFKTDTRRAEIGSIKSDLYYEMGKIKGKVQNNTVYPLEHLVIYTSTGFVEVGNIAAGESRNVEMTVLAARSNRYGDIIYAIIDDIFPWTSVTTARDKEGRKDMTRRRVLENLLAPGYLDSARPYPVTKPGEIGNDTIQSMEVAYFAFFEGQPESGIMVNGRQPDRITSDGIIMGYMDLIVERDGIVAIPPGMLTGQYEEKMSQGTDTDREWFYIHDPAGYAVFSFDLSSYIHLKDLKVQIGINVINGSGDIYIYEPILGDFGTKVEGDSVQIDESNFSKYVGIDNKIYIKILPGANQYLHAGLPVITLEGREQ
ncbi:MAG TPA: hypothetical protein GX505_13830 [Clostridiales bacterium]|nr:hypothetical protein [Clostridiales bacterium]